MSSSRNFCLVVLTFLAPGKGVTEVTGRAGTYRNMIPGRALCVYTALVYVIAGVLALVLVAKFVPGAIAVLGAISVRFSFLL